MIDHKNKIIFIHIPKCAGTSIEIALTGKDWWKSHPDEKHLTAQEARKYYGEEIWNSYFKVAFIRNPFTRLISAYNWIKKQVPALSKEYPDFATFIRKITSQPRTSDGVLHGGSIHDYITNEQGKVMVDFVGKFENLYDDFTRLCSLRHLSINLPRINVEVYDHNPNIWYTPELRRLVTDRYQHDLDTFHYSFPVNSEKTLPGGSRFTIVTTRTPTASIPTTPLPLTSVPITTVPTPPLPLTTVPLTTTVQSSGSSLHEKGGKPNNRLGIYHLEREKR
jgi:chondroitin 4-sulfotransferase 11